MPRHTDVYPDENAENAFLPAGSGGGRSAGVGISLHLQRAPDQRGEAAGEALLRLLLLLHESQPDE